MVEEEKMKKISILAFVLFVILLVVVIYVDKIKKTSEQKIRIFGKIDKNNIVRFDIKNIGTDELVSCEKNKDGIWEITKPKLCKTEPSEIETVLSEFADIAVEKKVSDKTPNLDQYGLKNPKNQISFYMTDNIIHVLIIGDKNPSQSAYYVKNATKDAVYTAMNYSIDNLLKTAKDLRKKEFFEFAADKAVKMTVNIDGKSKEFVRIEKEKWDIVFPIKEKAKSEEVISLVISIRNVKALDFIEDDPRPDKEFGLSEKNGNNIKIWIENIPEPYIFNIGGKLKDKNTIYARTSLNPCIYEVNSDLLNDFEKDAEWFKEEKKEENDAGKPLIDHKETVKKTDKKEGE